jgi:hypothetical protein
MLFAMQLLVPVFAGRDASNASLHFLCLPTGKASPAALAAARDIAAMIDGDASREDAGERRCPLCCQAAATTVAAPFVEPAAIGFNLPAAGASAACGPVHPAAGPPLGLRAPPALFC